MSESGQSMQPPPRIMMIDDELSNLQIVKIILMRENYESELLLYDNGRDALEYLRGHAVDLILLDLAMPGMDGFEVMTRLSENPATKEIPVIFLSAYQETEYILRAFELGATDFIGKPIISPVLTARIRYIIETRRLQTALLSSNGELVNTNRLKDELLSICSHDLRSPLSAIELICQFLADAQSGRSEQSPTELINRIVSQSRLARRLVENLLDLNRLEEGRLAPAPACFPIGELVADCVDDELPTMQARGLQHSFDATPAAVLCFGDREMLAQVLRNILNNATKYATGRIDVSCRYEHISDDVGGSLRISVHDDGRGIPAGQQRTIFEKYAKLEAQGGGSGLGLYISHQMVELHHGAIFVKSQPGAGTTFEIELPNAFNPNQLPDLSAYHSEPVVVISSFRPTAQLLDGVLVEAGMLEVAQVTTKAQAEAALAGHTPTLAVIDAESEELMDALVERLSASAQPVRWIVYGGRAKSAALAQRIGPAALQAEAPLNPLALLRLVTRQLEQPRPASASAGG